MNSSKCERKRHVSFIGSVGIPNRYGGFESFLENCAPVVVSRGVNVSVTCDSRVYKEKTSKFKGVNRIFIDVPANGGWSIVHDLVAFMAVFFRSTHIVVLGVSGGIWFPFFRFFCFLFDKELLVNIDGVEWRRTKFSPWRRALLRVFDSMAQFFSHKIIFDNAGLAPYILRFCKNKSFLIGYSGDHVLRVDSVVRKKGTALTICRIEPENNLEMLIQGFLQSKASSYLIVGNWMGSEYGRKLRLRYDGEPRIKLLDPIYDPAQLASLRESCEIYLHGHSVGGTNPSLVEMLFYDCRVLCFDVVFNRETAGDCAEYFRDAGGLSETIDEGCTKHISLRVEVRNKYSKEYISSSYLSAMKDVEVSH